MMLQIDHRESRDVDIFLQDPQLLSLLDPDRRDFDFELRPSAHDGDGAKFLKLVFENVGEIDFIVGQPRTANATTRREIEGEDVLLETIPEIITKKIVYRGTNIRPRDIFDIAAASEDYADTIIAELRSYWQATATALARLEQLNPEFVNNAISQLLIRQKFSATAKTAIEHARRLLRAV
ncbi:MAG: nucleotidyl transferase AbiEii/AbiGii toxin family protein [Xanthobacteraceae bacterium]|nr:nucleotidyl transferase AbiEii/AbiGii toxin family protein [Xanthobacteraceae bacterium]